MYIHTYQALACVISSTLFKMSEQCYQTQGEGRVRCDARQKRTYILDTRSEHKHKQTDTHTKCYTV